MPRLLLPGLILTSAFLAACDDKSSATGSHPNEPIPTGPKSSLGKARQSARDVVASGKEGMGGQSREAVLMRAEQRLTDAETAVNDLMSRAPGEAMDKVRVASAKLQPAKVKFAAAQNANPDDAKAVAALETALAELEAAIAAARQAAG